MLYEKFIIVKEILVILNNLNDKLKFKYETRGIQVNYLDIESNLKKSTKIDIYYKIADIEQYFQFKSCHPRH